MPTNLDNLRITTDFSLRICALLRASGVEVGIQQSIACVQATLLVGTFSEDELKGIYSATLINRKQDLWQLYRVFDLVLRDYLSQNLTDQDLPKDKRDPVVVQRRIYSEDSSSSETGGRSTQTQGYSVHDVDHRKDFNLIPKRDISSALAALKNVAKKHASIRRRKYKHARRSGRLDLRNSVRDSVRYDGEIIKWRFKRKKPTRLRFVVVSDVSGSMEIYSIFLLNFLHVLNSSRQMKMESFVFSTRLECLTKQFRSRNFSEMLENVTAHFTAWSGGTKIGVALEDLNHRYGGLITPKTTVIIMSDGWDTGDIALLDNEMATLHRRAKSVIWINPLKAAPGYEPIAIGMATARPYCDQFITGHSIDSLEAFAGLLGS